MHGIILYGVLNNNSIFCMVLMRNELNIEWNLITNFILFSGFISHLQWTMYVDSYVIHLVKMRPSSAEQRFLRRNFGKYKSWKCSSPSNYRRICMNPVQLLMFRFQRITLYHAKRHHRCLIHLITFTASFSGHLDHNTWEGEGNKCREQ